MGTCQSTPQPVESLELLLQKPPKARVQNILIRDNCSDQRRVGSNLPFQFFETSHILKYNPKYYRNLTLEMTRQNRLVSKVKKIKKLKKFTGLFKDRLRQKLWFNLLANNRKEIKEIPETICKGPLGAKLGQSFWKRLNLQKVKFFYNVKIISESNGVAFLKESFVKYLWGMRRLKTLRISVKDQTYNQTKRVIKKLNRMGRFLCRLETLSLCLQTFAKNHGQLIQNKTFFSYVTEIGFDSLFDPIYTEILQISKNLKSSSIHCWGGDKANFVDVLTALKMRLQLKRLAIDWPLNGINFWSYFKPQSSLQSLALKIYGSDFMNENPFKENIEGNWENLKELHFDVLYSKLEEIQNTRRFMTMILEKVPKLRFLRISVTGCWTKGESSLKDESFVIEDLSYLYESLEVFEYRLSHFNQNYFPKFDFGLLKPFKNLKKLKVDGIFMTSFAFGNVEEAVCLLEENQKEGEVSVLELEIDRTQEQDWLGETLQKIQKIKRKDRNMNFIFSLRFTTKNSLKLLEKLCKDIKAAKPIKGLKIELVLECEEDFKMSPAEKIKKILSKYREICDLSVLLNAKSGRWECIKVGGKTQFSLDLFHGP